MSVASAANSTGGLPLRTADAVTSGDVGLVLLATLALLGAAYAVLWFAKHKGLVDRLTRRGAEPIEVLGSRRLSVHTTVHLVRAAGRTALVTESARHAELTVLDSTAGQEPSAP